MTISSPEGQRLPPQLPVTAMRTFQILAPLSTHFRAATCEEVNCLRIINGFMVPVDESTDLGRKQAHYIRNLSGRAFTEARDRAGLTVFTFQPGQRCFDPHRVRADRPERYLTRPGDWRGNPSGRPPVEHTKAEFWVEDFAENQDRIARQIEKG
jgi:hypothetical protein